MSRIGRRPVEIPDGVEVKVNDVNVVTVRGPQWPWKPATNLTYSELSNDLCVGICRGAVAVHTKTIRLESSVGSSYGTGMSVVVPPGATPGFYFR